ncbi:MAG: LacI family DNA-binding transcriptional regulator [Bryobacteraceae bacterium]
MTQKITLQDVGRRLGLSTTTVSLALRDHPRISKATKEKIHKMIAEMNYEPDQVARALVMGRSNLIGVIVPNSSDPYYAEVFKGIEDGARASNFHILLSNGSYELEPYEQRARELMSLRVGGIIMAPPFTQERPKLPGFWRQLRDRHFPIVLINRQLKPPIFHQVAAAYSHGMKAVVETLAALGHHRVAYVSGEVPLLPIRQRLADFRRYARRHGFDDDAKLIVAGPLTPAGGYEACRQLWSTVERKPTAIVIFSDTVAVGVLRFLHDEGVHIPGDISLISLDGTAASEFTHPSLTTVTTPMYDIGRKGFELLLSSMEKKEQEPQSVILPVQLVPRESVGVARKERPV